MMSNPIVKVQEGELKGKISKTLNNIDFFTFKGIPYAKPPVSDLRFCIPVPPETWEGVRDATKDCNICAQLDVETQSVVGHEDCLYLNVYTPKLPPDDGPLLPVMVFMHGGGFLFGHGTDDSAHGADYLVEKDVVIVSLNYRIGILGFLSLDRRDAPGNMGLRDQVQALKWVQGNIKQFGGDPGNVTIFGISAGGAAVEYLVLSPLAKGLFHKAIAQSGSTLLPWAQSRSIKDLTYKIPPLKGEIVNTDESLLQFLKKLSTEDLIKLSMAAINITRETWHGGLYFGFVPTVEKPKDWVPFLDQRPYDLLSRGQFTKVPFLSGFCTREGLLMVTHGAPRLEKLNKEKSFLDFLPFDVDETEKSYLENQLKATYLNGEQEFNDEDACAIDFFTDVDFLGGGYVSTTLIAKYNPHVYFYEFAYDGGLNYLKKKHKINRKGACHGDDGGYIIKSNILLGGEISQTDKLVKNRMVEMWTNFAKFGDPTPRVTEIIPTKWEPAAETVLSYLHIDEDIKMKERLFPARVKLFEELYRKYDLLF